MIATLLRLALKQRFLSVLLAAGLVGLGLWAFTQLSVEAYPDISDTQVVVITLHPGHAAEEMEQQVSVPILCVPLCTVTCRRVQRSRIFQAALSHNRHEPESPTQPTSVTILQI